MKPVQAQVTLVCHSPNPEQLLAAAAKLCYAADTESLFEQDSASAGRFVKMLRGLGHMSPVEHATFTFYVEGVSRSMTHQLVRHRLASYSQRSQRYVDHEDFDYVVPPQLAGKTVEDQGRQVDAVEYFTETMALLAGRYRKLSQALGRTAASSNEDARYVLPNACETKILMTMNARELLHFLEERLCLRAQWEIRTVADRMLELVRPVLAGVFADAGPKCIRLGGCPEGKLTCGRYAEIKARYTDHEGSRESETAMNAHKVIATVMNSGQWQIERCVALEGGCPNALTGLEDLAEQLDTVVRDSGWAECVRAEPTDRTHRPHSRLRVALAACPNACTQPQIRDIGLIASVRPVRVLPSCTGCGQCAMACREEAIAMEDGLPALTDARCLGCGQCGKACPQEAMEMGELRFRVLVGGRMGRHPAWALELPAMVGRAQVASVVAQLLRTAKDGAGKGETFGAAARRLGAALWQSVPELSAATPNVETREMI